MFGHATKNQAEPHAETQAEIDRRTGAERRIGAERRNGFSVLLAGCPECGRIAPAPADMHTEGWLIVADDEGINLIACPEHRAHFETPSRPAAGVELQY